MPVRKKKNGWPKKETDKRYARLTLVFAPTLACEHVFFSIFHRTYF